MIDRKQNTEVGMVLTLVLLVAGLITGLTIWFKVGVCTLLVAVLIPVVYTPLSWGWYGFARLVERVCSRGMLTFIFFLVVTPVALLRRCFSGDTLRLRSFKKQKNSVFIVKEKRYTKEDLDKQY